MTKINVSCREITTTLKGYLILLDIHYKLLYSPAPINELDFSRVSWVDANMCAPFGALLWSYFNSTEAWGKETRISNMNKDLESILEKNGFLSDICLDCTKKQDLFKTVIEYRRFDNCDSSLFKEYVKGNFIKKHIGPHVPEMGGLLKKKFHESIFEIYENAIFHSQTKLGIFACGQYFPRKELLNFSIVDLGIGIRENLFQKLKLNYAPERAISWALDGENTTRQCIGGTPGGLGLKLIKNFIYSNKGNMMIISDRGYWNFRDGREELRSLPLAFPGTAVNIVINTKGQAGSDTFKEAIPENIF